MDLPLSVHLAIHFLLSLFSGLVVWRFYKCGLKNSKKRLFVAVLSALIAGFFIDVDHLIDYFLAFGFRFNLGEFLSGAQFAKTDKIHILFHGWEYVPILLVLFLVLKNKIVKTIILAVTLSSLVHLWTDIVLNEGMTIKAYSVVYRIKNGFKIEKLVTEEHWLEHLENKGH